jgi:hypothetical protein
MDELTHVLRRVVGQPGLPRSPDETKLCAKSISGQEFEKGWKLQAMKLY